MSHSTNQITKLIINSPYREPERHWAYNRETRSFELKSGRRAAGYLIASPGNRGDIFDDPGQFIELETVNRIRQRVSAWAAADYPNATGITRRLLQHWQDESVREGHRFFFCQLEAIQTLMWWVEAPAAERVGIALGSDGSPFERVCCKMATGSGKTIVMAMILAWQILNRRTYPQDNRFSSTALLVAPGLTVKSWLEVLQPHGSENYFDRFSIIPPGLEQRLREGQVHILNWHRLAYENQESLDKKKKSGKLRSVDKRAYWAKSDTAWLREVLPGLTTAERLLILNDEAHHAWRSGADTEKITLDADEKKQATVWITGLERLHRARGILRCFDLSATPYLPTGKKASGEHLFSWIVSDFGLNDAIESGLVKTPRVVIRENNLRDPKLKPKLYHLYDEPEIREDLGRKGAQPTDSLPDLLLNAYALLGSDWRETFLGWQAARHPVPPVLITVANNTTTAERIEHALLSHHSGMENLVPAELREPDKILRIDSKALKEVEKLDSPPIASHPGGPSDAEATANPDEQSISLTKEQQAEALRQKINTVGKLGQPGEQLRHIISVNMLSEGWDAATVTHILGLRAFSSQLLCEQVVGRGLRRVSYEVGPDGLLEPEYVNIFGIPFAFLPHESNTEGKPPPPEKPRTRIEPSAQKVQHAIQWPNVLRIQPVYRDRLLFEATTAEPIRLNPLELVTETELGALVDGKPNEKIRGLIGLDRIAEDLRLQTLIFRLAAAGLSSEPVFQRQPHFLVQVVQYVEQFIAAGKVELIGGFYPAGSSKWKVLVMLHLNQVLQHIWQQIRTEENIETLELILDTAHPVCSTAHMRPWHTSKPCEWASKSHISHCVYDSSWESTEAYLLEKSELVCSFAKNDHLGFYVYYSYKGIIRKYYPDFLVRLTNGVLVVLEVKGQSDAESRAKKAALQEWVRAVNQDGRWGTWSSAESVNPSDLPRILKEAMMAAL